MTHKIEFNTPLQINVNVSITQKQDERVAQLEAQLADQKDVIDFATKQLNMDADQLKAAVDAAKPS